MNQENISLKTKILNIENDLENYKRYTESLEKRSKLLTENNKAQIKELEDSFASRNRQNESGFLKLREVQTENEQILRSKKKLESEIEILRKALSESQRHNEEISKSKRLNKLLN